MVRGSWFFRCFAVLGAFVLSGCFTYVPVRQAVEGSTVRAHLPVESTVAGVARTTEDVTVEGTVVTHGDSLVLTTSSTARFGNFREVQQVDTLRVASERVSRIEERSLSRGRTLGFTLLVGAGVMALVAGIAGAAGGGDDGGNGGGGGTASLRIPSPLGWLTGILGGG